MGQILHQQHVEGCQHCQTIGCCTTGEKLKHVPDPMADDRETLSAEDRAIEDATVDAEAALDDPDWEKQTITSANVGSLEEILPDVTTDAVDPTLPEGEAKVVVVNEGMAQKEDL